MNDGVFMRSERNPMGSEIRLLLNLIGKAVPQGMPLPERGRVFLCGGALVSAYTGTRVNDLDLYFPGGREAAEPAAAFLADKGGLRTVNACTLRNEDLPDVQVILLQGGVVCPSTTVDILRRFDFLTCMGGLELMRDADGKWRAVELAYANQFFRLLAARRLALADDIEYPICTVARAAKYVARGYRLEPLAALRLGLMCALLDFKDPAEVKRHLLGVDVLVVQSILEELAGAGAEKVPQLFPAVVSRRMADVLAGRAGLAEEAMEPGTTL